MVTIMIAPPVAKSLASEGYSKETIRQYLYEHARVTYQELEFVLVTDDNGDPVANVTVDWSANDDGSPARSRTSRRCAASWRTACSVWKAASTTR